MSKKASSSKKSTGNEGMLPKMELIIIAVFFLSFVVWAMSKCSSTQAQYEKKAAPDTEQVEPKTTTETTKPKAKKTKPKEKVAKKSTTPVKTAPPEKVTVLYVILDELKLRKGPHLDSSIVRTLKLDNEVYYLNEVTDFKQEINLGDRMAYEPWIKVRAYSGHEGWVYGAGVHYFKPKPSLDTVSR